MMKVTAPWEKNNTFASTQITKSEKQQSQGRINEIMHYV
jgi:hypothetical protein